MPKRRIDTINGALRAARQHPQYRLEGVRPNVITRMAARGLAIPTPDGSGWRLSEAGRNYYPQPH